MASSHRDRHNTAFKRPSKPILSVDTKASRKMLVRDQPLRSAPVGTRQEKGIPPMYQLVDRHCEKLAEMMNSPTWRNQNFGSHLVQPAKKPTVSVASRGHHSLDPTTREEAICDDQHSDDEPQHGNFSIPVASSPSSGTTLVDELQLSRGSEDIRLIGLQPFLKTSEGTYILSASTSCNVNSSQEVLCGELRRVKVFQRRISTWSEAKEPADAPREAENEALVHDYGDTGLTSLRSGRSSKDVDVNFRTDSEEAEDDARELMKQDETIQSINNSFRPGRRHWLHVRNILPDDKQRFGGILQRLRQQCTTQPSPDSPPFGDPAIIAFAPKKEDADNITKRRGHVRSDSGYASQRTGRGSSEATMPDSLRVQHSQGESNDSAVESPSKKTSLNPAAKEFSSAGSKGFSPVKSNVFARPPVHSKLWLPPQQLSEPTGLSPPINFGPLLNTIPTPWLSPQANVSTPLMTLGSMQAGFSPPFPGLLPQIGDLTGGVMPPPPGLGMAGTVPPIAPFTGLSPGPCQPCVHGSMPGLVAPCYHGSFHQQLPNFMTCNNPTHQGLSAFSPPALTPSLPATLMSQAPATNLSVHGAAQQSMNIANLPKSVPKPKAPNTMGQQNWELIHELRRTNEPGYAQKCKEKQKKRYLKQLEKTGGSGA